MFGNLFCLRHFLSCFFSFNFVPTHNLTSPTFAIQPPGLYYHYPHLCKKSRLQLAGIASSGVFVNFFP